MRYTCKCNKKQTKYLAMQTHPFYTGTCVTVRGLTFQLDSYLSYQIITDFAVVPHNYKTAYW